MNKILLMVLICLLTINAAFAQNKCRPAKHARLPVITETIYSKGRKLLIGAGWQPLQTILNNKGDSDPKIAYGNGPVFWERGYFEIEACSGTGLAACSFLFSDVYGNRLRVTTLGEELSKPRAHARVTHYFFVCGDVSSDSLPNVVQVGPSATPSKTPVVGDLPVTVHLDIKGVDAGTTYEDVLLKLGKPLSSKKAGTNPCGGTKLTLRYPGLTIALDPDDDDEKNFIVVSIRVDSPKWEFAPGLTIGASPQDVHNKLGRSGELRTPQSGKPVTTSIFYYVRDGAATFYFRQNKLVMVEWNLNLC